MVRRLFLATGFSIILVGSTTFCKQVRNPNQSLLNASRAVSLADQRACRAEGTQPFHYGNRLFQIRPNWIVQVEKDLTQRLLRVSALAVPLLTGYTGTKEGITSLTEVSFKSCSREEHDAIVKNGNILSLVSSFFIEINRVSNSLAERDLAVVYVPERNLTVVSFEKNSANTRFDKPTTTSSIAVDFITHHNQSLDAWHKASLQGVFSHGKRTVVHIDSHSDLYVYSAGKKAARSIADYLNYAAQEADGKNYQVEHVIWVLPDTFKIGAPPVVGAPFHVSQEPPYSTRTGDVRVTVTKLSQLDFNALPEGYLLDIDLDYFSNSGTDTRFEWGNNVPRAALLSNLNAFVQTAFVDAKPKPAFVTVASSPGFTPWEDLVEIRSYFQRAFTYGDFIPNTVANYTYHYDEGHDTFLKAELAWLRGRSEPCLFSNVLFEGFHIFGAEDGAAEYAQFCRKP